MKIQQAVILAGGTGSRLKEITKNTPKPLIRFNNKPFISYIIEELEKAKIKKVIILAGYMGSLIKKIFSKNKNINVIIEKKPLGTGGSIVSAIKHLDKYFLLLNGDSYINLNLKSKILNYSNSYSKIFITQNKNYKSNKLLNKLYLNKNRKVIFSKSKSFMYSGVSIFKKSDFSKYKKNTFISLENTILNNLIKTEKIYGEINNENFIDIGTKKNFLKAKKNIKKILKKKCFFFDRDNTLICDKGYTFRKKDLKWMPGAKKAIKFLNENNYLVIVITNQSGVARGYYTEKHVEEFHKYLNESLYKDKAYIDDFFYCPFHENGLGKYKKKTNLRKPGNLMIKNSIKKWNINIKESHFIGDGFADELAAKKSNLKFTYTDNKNLLYLVKNIIKKYEHKKNI